MTVFDGRTGEDLISLVIPVYNEEENLEALHEELSRVLPQLGAPAEVLLVDDGSADGSWAKIREIAAADPRVRGLRFSRNYGHQYALLAGLDQARGDAVISMDADLQHPPELLAEMVREWRAGAKIVNTIRIEPQGLSPFKTLTSKLFYKFFTFISGIPIEKGMADFRLLDRQVVESVRQYKEAGVFFRGIVQTIGFPVKTLTYQCRDRFAGRTKYTLGKMINFAWTGISSFSIVPLRLAIFLGILTSLISFYELGYVIVIRIFTERAVPGWASAVGIISLMFGMLFILLGIIGEYIGRILIEVRGRPRYLVQETAGPAAGQGPEA